MPFEGNAWSDKKFMPYKEMIDKIRTKLPLVRLPVRHVFFFKKNLSWEWIALKLLIRMHRITRLERME